MSLQTAQRRQRGSYRAPDHKKKKKKKKKSEDEGLLWAYARHKGKGHTLPNRCQQKSMVGVVLWFSSRSAQNRRVYIIDGRSSITA